MPELPGETPHATPPCEHLVQVYRDSHELAEAVATFLASGFAADEPAVVVATQAHWPLFVQQLDVRGWNAEHLRDDGSLLLADAEATLASISGDGMPSRRRFAEVVGELIDRAAANAPRRRVRVFGEMVDLLCRRGDGLAADELEALWNELGTRRHFTLLCGYRLDLFDRDVQVRLLPQVYRSHTQVVSASDAERLEAAVQSALTAILGEEDAQKVYARVARRRRDAHVPASQLALMWVSAHMPRAAEEILASAHERYAAAAAA